MSDKGGNRGDTRLYKVIAFFVIIVVFIGMIFSGPKFIPAYVNDYVITDGWIENPVKRENGSQLLGLEKWSSFTYEIDGRYPSYLTVTTIKSLVMMNEEDLKEKTQGSIAKAELNGIVLDNGSEISGRRVLYNKHETIYVVYDGADNSTNPSEKIKIIGEVWNCPMSGTSVICIGVSQITDNANGNTTFNTTNWERIVGDEEGTFGLGEMQTTNGLIYNVVCH